jgi:hypothetical protein
LTIHIYRDVYYVGLSNKSISRRKGTRVDYANSFVLKNHYNEYECRLAGKKHNWEWPEGATRPEWSDGEDVFGCGLVLSPDNKWAIFFTMNGLLFGQFFVVRNTVRTKRWKPIKNWDN